MEPPLRDPLLYSNWVLILGIALLVVAATWVIGLLVAYRRSKVRPEFEVRSLSQAHRARYSRLIDEVSTNYGSGVLTGPEAHLALAAIIRAAATERTRINLESATASEARVLAPGWPILADALAWCEDGSFPAGAAAQRVDQGLGYAQAVVFQ